jgi:predicted transcriptional regulator
MTNLNDCDEAIIKVLREGRSTAKYLETVIDWNRQYITQRLLRLENIGLVENLNNTGLYQIKSSATIELKDVD